VLKALGITFLVLADPAIAAAYQHAGGPIVYVVDKEGNICDILDDGFGPLPPYHSEEVIREQIRDSLLACGAGESKVGSPASFELVGLTTKWSMLPILYPGPFQKKQPPIPEPDPPPLRPLHLISRPKQEAVTALAMTELARGFGDMKTRRALEATAIDALEAAVARIRREFDRAPTFAERTSMATPSQGPEKSAQSRPRSK
jgi:hypothetical protein